MHVQRNMHPGRVSSACWQSWWMVGVGEHCHCSVVFFSLSFSNHRAPPSHCHLANMTFRPRARWKEHWKIWLLSFLRSFFFFFFNFQVGLFGSSLWYTSVCGCKRVFRHRGSILQSGQPSHCECLHQELEAVDEPQSSPFRGLCCLAAWFGSRCNPNTTIIAFWLQVFSLL